MVLAITSGTTFTISITNEMDTIKNSGTKNPFILLIHSNPTKNENAENSVEI